MKKKKIGNYGDICRIYYYNREDIDTTIIISRKDNELVYIDFNVFGEYNGHIFQNFLAIEDICYDDEYIPFYEKAIDKSTINYLNLLTKEDFVKYALENNKILAILTEYDLPDINFLDIKVLEFDGKYIKYQYYERWGQLRKRIYKVDISKIVMLQVDSKYQRLLERIREE